MAIEVQSARKVVANSRLIFTSGPDGESHDLGPRIFTKPMLESIVITKEAIFTASLR